MIRAEGREAQSAKRFPIKIMRNRSTRTNNTARTAKSYGPGIPVLMPCATRKRCRNRAAMSARATGAIKPVPGESTYKPLKPSRREGRLSGPDLW
jgi:hypothetical protein